MRELIEIARDLARSGERRILGVAGAPGAGKSTLAAAIVDALDGRARLAPMDGYHLAQAELERLGRADRKGAPDTFDAGGYVALLRRLRAADEEIVYAPRFDRHAEEPVAGAIGIEREVPLVVTEGNYLLLDDGPWREVRGLLDAAWFVQVDDDLRRAELVERHVRHGRSPEAAEDWVRRVDEPNATLVAASRDRADLVVSRSGVVAVDQSGR